MSNFEIAVLIFSLCGLTALIIYVVVNIVLYVKLLNRFRVRLRNQHAEVWSAWNKRKFGTFQFLVSRKYRDLSDKDAVRLGDAALVRLNKVLLVLGSV